jgi:hypothetical protein
VYEYSVTLQWPRPAVGNSTSDMWNADSTVRELKSRLLSDNSHAPVRAGAVRSGFVRHEGTSLLTAHFDVEIDFPKGVGEKMISNHLFDMFSAHNSRFPDRYSIGCPRIQVKFGRKL